VPNLKWIAVRGFSKNCAIEQAPSGEWKARYVNQKRFGSESNLITGWAGRAGQGGEVLSFEFWVLDGRDEREAQVTVMLNV
jgi:hypothetical protein